MTEEQWDALSSFCRAFRKKCGEWEEEGGTWLKGLQLKAAARDGIPDYPVETPVVYNTALDELCPEDDIRLVIVGDNPGKDEQRARNRRYLVGQAGKLAARFFAIHTELGIDFRRNALILNKTPIHSARTRQLKFLIKEGGRTFLALLEESERFMAESAAALQAAFCCPLWVTGYSEMRKGGVFESYAQALNETRGLNDGALEGDLLFFQHFSMNRFAIDLRGSIELRGKESLSLPDRLALLGRAHRKEILGW